MSKQQNADLPANQGDTRIMRSPSTAARHAFFYIQECGHLKVRGEHHTSRENLQSFLVVLVVDGKGTLCYDGQEYRLKAGDCFFIDCRAQHSYQSDPESPWEILWAHFNGSTSEEYYKIFATQRHPVLHPIASVKFATLMQELMDLNAEPYADTEALTSGVLVNLLTLLLTAKNVGEAADSSLQIKLKSLLAHIDANFTEEIHLDELSARFDISKYYLTREFKRAYGETIFQHIIGLRINYAKRLLRFTDKSVEEIALLCGFNDQSYFSKQFKKAENVTCLAFRRRWRD